MESVNSCDVTNIIIKKLHRESKLSFISNIRIFGCHFIPIHEDEYYPERIYEKRLNLCSEQQNQTIRRVIQSHRLLLIARSFLQNNSIRFLTCNSIESTFVRASKSM